MKKVRTIALSLCLLMLLWFALAACENKGGGGKGQNGAENSVKVSFNLNYDNLVLPDRDAAIGGTYGELPAPVRFGWTFSGWYYNKSCTDGPVAGTDKVSEADHTLYAKWIAKKIKITFDITDCVIEFLGVATETGGVIWKEIDFAYGGTYGGLPSVTRDDGLEFVFWYALTDGKETGVSNASTVATDSDHTLYAKWKTPKTVWDFTDPDDRNYFNVTSAFLNEPGTDVPISLDGDKLKVVNTDGADGRWIQITTPIKSNTTVKWDVKMEFPGGVMTKPVTFRLLGFSPDGDFGSKSVSPSSGAWPSENDGKKTVSFDITSACNSVALLVNMQETLQANRVGIIIYVHRVMIVPTVDKTVWDFTDSEDRAYFNATSYTEQAGGPGYEEDMTLANGKLTVINSVPAANKRWIQFNPGSSKLNKGETMKWEVSAGGFKNGMDAAITFDLYGFWRSGANYAEEPIGSKSVSPAANAWPASAGGGGKTLNYDIADSKYEFVSMLVKFDNITDRTDMAVYVHSVKIVPTTVKTVWDFTDPDDRDYFNENSYADAGSVPMTLDGGKLKIENSNGAPNRWIQFNHPVAASSKITYQIRLVLSDDMDSAIAFTGRILRPGQSPGEINMETRTVSPVSNAWPTSNGGVRTMEYNVTQSCSFFALFIDFGTLSNRYVTICIHSLTVTPPQA